MVLPLVVVSMLLVVQVALLVWDQLRVAHAAREGARALAVTNTLRHAEDAALRAGAFPEGGAAVEISPADRPAGTPARVTVRYRPKIVVPFVGRFLPQVTLTGSAWMRVERDPP